MPDRWIGALLGAAGGVVGLAAMGGVMRAATRLLAGNPQDNKERQQGPEEHPSISLVGPQHEPDEASTAAVGRILYTRLAGHPPADATRARLSTGVHWSYGVLMAAGYGMLRAGRPGFDVLGGLAFAVGLWAIGDELIVPLLGLSDAPQAYPARHHAQALAGHLAYGVATAATTQRLARVFNGHTATKP